MQVGIIGPQGSGKSALFHCLTGLEAAVSGKMEIIRGMAEAADDRLTLVAKHHNSHKATPTTVEYLDAPPIESGGLKRSGFKAVFLRGLEQTDALLLVIPCFLAGQVEKAKSALADIETEFMLCDLEGVENRLSKIARDLKRGVKGQTEKEGTLLEICKRALENETSLRNVEIPEDDFKLLKGFMFLSYKPILPILNIAENDIKAAEQVVEQTGIQGAVPICATVEAELLELPESDIPLFRKEMGIERSAREIILQETRKLLQLITFYTGSEAESRAWDLKNGSTALKAAGTVHSDMEKGFIRAEVIHYQDLESAETIAELRAKGLIHLEGRDYVVQDDDLILFRFNV